MFGTVSGLARMSSGLYPNYAQPLAIRSICAPQRDSFSSSRSKPRSR